MTLKKIEVLIREAERDNLHIHGIALTVTAYQMLQEDRTFRDLTAVTEPVSYENDLLPIFEKVASVMGFPLYIRVPLYTESVDLPVNTLILKEYLAKIRKQCAKINLEKIRTRDFFDPKIELFKSLQQKPSRIHREFVQKLPEIKSFKLF